MLGKELAQAVNFAQRANREVSKLKAKLLKEAEGAVARNKRELASACKKQSAANARLKKARASYRKKTEISVGHSA